MAPPPPVRWTWSSISPAPPRSAWTSPATRTSVATRRTRILSVAATVVVNPLAIGIQSHFDFSGLTDAVSHIGDAIDHYLPGIGSILGFLVNAVINIVPMSLT